MERKFGRLRLAILRKNQGLSGERLGELTGLTQGFISAVERGEKSPSLETIISLAKALDTSVAYLMCETEDPAPPSARERSAEIAEAIEGIDTSKPEAEFQASRDLDNLIRELAAVNPDLIVNFRTTTKNFKDYTPNSKKKIAQGMLFVLGLGELKEEDGFRVVESDEDL